MADVVCLRPRADFEAVGITPPPELDIAYRAPEDDDVAELIRGARALVIPAVGPALPGDLFRGTALELVQVTGAGLDRLDRAVLAGEGIALANVPGGSNAALAEYVVVNALSLLRGFHGAGAALRAGDYAAHRKRMVDAVLRGLGGLVVGVVGIGTIGQAVAERCRQMGAEIAYFDPAPPDGAPGKRMDLDALLAASDVVTLHLPLIDATRGLIDARRIGLMKPGAVLINAARGGIVDEAALAKALEEERLAGAAVDVYATEPPGPDNPLLTLAGPAAQRLILTPHIAGVSLQASQHLFREAWDNVSSVLLGGAVPRNRVAA
ncbi:MAG: putative dehydrogenase [Rhodobacteraceae bacterium HLUCCA08]|nr:MAG: putative dehydrogenase [Rhodobacteraceae bacterium HLUCCA08]